MPHRVTLHGQTWNDEYHWLRRRDDPRVRAWLERENHHTAAATAHSATLRKRLFAEMRGRIQETDSSVPVRDGPYRYYSRTVQGLQYPIHCRRPAAGGAEQVLIDENALAADAVYFDLGAYAPSPDHRLLAYTVDDSGDEVYALRVLDLDSGRLLDDAIADTAGDFEWAEDGRTLFYTRMDAAHRPNRLYRHRLGSDPAADPLVLREDDQAFHLYIGKTRSRRYLVLHAASISADEFHVLEADRPAGRFRVVQPRRPGLEYELDHHGDHFYLVTNHRATNFRLVRAPVAAPGLEHWQEVIAHRPQAQLVAVDLFCDHMLIQSRQDGLTAIQVRELASGATHRVAFAEPAHTAWMGDNPEFDSRDFQLIYSSLTTPRTVYRYHPDARRLERLKRQPVQGGYEPAAYETLRLSAQAPDGTAVPISLVRRRDATAGPRPTYLVGYGAYGDAYEPLFSTDRLSLLDRGLAVAIAHVRGGGELGRPWYDAGRLLNKRNTFTDFIACAEHLIDRGLTASDRLAIGGGSAGGLLIGAVLNMRPELFAAAVADVPFVDVIHTMLDDSLPLTVTEYDEWGDPHRPEVFALMCTYSPYDNVRAQAYPPLLVTAGWNDPRVQYWEPAKWVARLRAHQEGDAPLLLKTNLEAGHAGASGRYDYLEEIAFEYAFVLDQLGAD